jgi:hypothetical protein
MVRFVVGEVTRVGGDGSPNDRRSRSGGRTPDGFPAGSRGQDRV